MKEQTDEGLSARVAVEMATEEQARLDSAEKFAAGLDGLDRFAFAPPKLESAPLPVCVLADLDRFAFAPGGEATPVFTCALPPRALPKTILRKTPPAVARPSPEQDLYVMTSSAFPGLLKVGRSNRPERRRLDLSGGQPVHYTLDVVFHGAGEHEPAVHAQLKDVQYNEGYSREWFACTQDDVIEAFRVVAPDKIEQIERMTVEVVFMDAHSVNP